MDETRRYRHITGVTCRSSIPGLGQGPAEEYFGELRRDLLAVQCALGFVPLVNPVDHTQQGESRSAATNISSGWLRSLNCRHQTFHEVNVFLFSSVDAF